MTISSLHELLRITLQRLHRSVFQLAAAIPRITEQVESIELLDALDAYAEEVVRQVERAEAALVSLQTAVDMTLCSGIEGLLSLLDVGPDAPGDGRISDVAILAALRRVGFSTISAYHTARVLAEVLGEVGVLRLVEENLRSEELFERILTVIGEELIDEVCGVGTPALRETVSAHASGSVPPHSVVQHSITPHNVIPQPSAPTQSGGASVLDTNFLPACRTLEN